MKKQYPKVIKVIRVVKVIKVPNDLRVLNDLNDLIPKKIMHYELCIKKSGLPTGSPDFLCSRLENALCHHGACHFHEAGYVRTLDIVDISVLLFAEKRALVVDFSHD